MSIMIFSYRSLDIEPVVGTNQKIIIWLWSLLGAVMVMVLIGAWTRLTDSGLSMVEWRPLMGALPPLSGNEWQRIFELYQKIPEYRQFPIDLAAFQRIFFWEYLHRLWGRVLGLWFFLPWGYFLLTGRLNRAQALALLLIPFLGGVQALVGWWMVVSGFVDRVDVSPYRLLIHLTLALVILLSIWEAILRFGRIANQPLRPDWRGWEFWFLGLLTLTIAAGALVAGTRAGLIYNQWPLMGEGLIPPDYRPDSAAVPLESLRLLLFEHLPSVQLHHRILAAATLFAIVLIFTRNPRSPAARLLLAGVIIQFLLGITTLITGVLPVIACLHQAGAIILLLGGWLCYRRRPHLRL